ncbi:DUF1206 domain-containing protein [Rhabdothermincola salaria]|uniref:DUF1206 domain-containing protein n=1 Tax=Rhabdothermincola salaria TaxID=2903142 RepID=UPI001E3F1610|nr:DUF1206 domain-containing protein [Rhabdothermincola salaria]MCD9623450.1 DUF1206 domain-containing protein [Rhabdothermincola salaria]
MPSVTDTVRHGSPGRGDWKETLGRVGLVGKGVVFAVIGVLAIQLALGDASGDTTKNGAIEWVGAQPLGKFLLVALTIALFALAAWRLLDALTGDPVEGSEPKDRAKFAVLGLLYLSLATAALSATIANWNDAGQTSQGGGTETRQQATAVVLDWPAGRWIVALIGLAIIGFAAYQVKKYVIDMQFLERVDVGEESWIASAGRWGYLARAIVLAMVGVFFIQAGLTYDASEAEGLSAALQSLSGEGWGQFVLWVVALGLLAFGVFTVAEAKHRKAA